ncbi:hypothetical protein EVAR_48872_1 [Eumeta japonica]|uniref:Uncharacterized protein n=1 Tax=Eumeta variegata TaxID=151549 RepID=A0A4C1Y8S0_EUMVA|nr:hypothetical protein EVAR_48872_1 [Eumeta japonica]
MKTFPCYVRGMRYASSKTDRHSTNTETRIGAPLPGPPATANARGHNSHGLLAAIRFLCIARGHRFYVAFLSTVLFGTGDSNLKPSTLALSRLGAAKYCCHQSGDDVLNELYII